MREYFNAEEREDHIKVTSCQYYAKKLAESNSDAGDDIPEEITKLIEERKEARKAKNFALADEIRDKIAEMGYVITETREGTKVTKK